MQRPSMRRNESLQDLSAVAKHFPAYLERRVATESFRHEAFQYALWLPLAGVAKYFGFHRTAYTFLTWFILGELLLIYMHQKVVKFVRWWMVLSFVAGAAALFHGRLNLSENAYWQFLVWYVIAGIVGFAVVLPFVPRRFLQGAPGVLFELGLIRRGFAGSTGSTGGAAGAGAGDGDGDGAGGGGGDKKRE